MPDKSPLVRKLEATVPAQGTANATQDQVLAEVPFDGTVTGVRLIPEANLTAHATNYRTFRVVNKGQSGSGTALVAYFATDTPTTDNLTAFDEKALTLSATPANLAVAEGDILVADELVAASGVAHSGYKIQVDISRS